MQQPKYVIAADLLSQIGSDADCRRLMTLVENIVSDSQDAASTLEAGTLTLRASSELALESLLTRIAAQYPIKASDFYILYLESVTQLADGEGKEIRQSMGRDHYAHVKLTVAPRNLSEPFQIVNAIQEGAIPEEFMRTVQQAIAKRLRNGVSKGFPVVDVVCTVVDGSYHEIDSSSEAFEQAAVRALLDAFRSANARLLEPIMRFEVRAPNEIILFLSEDLKRRRAWIHDSKGAHQASLLEGFVPLSEVLGYHRALEKMTDGRAQIVFRPDHYAVVEPDPPDSPLPVAVRA
jgi:elongation factor G